LGLKGGAVIANPIPEEYSMDSELINKVIKDAVAEAEKLGVKGKDTTPFLLDKIQKLTEGSSLKANIELVFNNTKLATKIAKELANLEK
jgi:pseudouridine-5'-phosphate glycosidase